MQMTENFRCKERSSVFGKYHRPPDRTVCLQTGACPSLGPRQMEMEPEQVICARACTTRRPFPPCLHLITLDAQLITHPQLPNAHHHPALPPAVHRFLPMALPRARNKLPLICIMLPISFLHTANHFSISFCKIHHE